MPIPTPNPDENESNFMSRCISFLVNEGEDQDQAVAICSTQWDQMKQPKFETKEEMFDWLIENKSMLIKQKKEAEYKKSDSILVSENRQSNKAETVNPNTSDKISVDVVINTTGILDSHKDVHIPGIWKRSLKQKKDIMLLQEHKMDFEHLISDQVKATAQTISWKELGFNFKGDTQALVFTAEIEKSENEFMFKRYARGAVKEHSVGMRYVKLELAINSDDNDYKEEKRAWDKYIDQVVNQKDAEEDGYFWAVTEAKVVEGSAVLKGSNSFTPTISVENKNLDDSSADTHHKPDPSNDTPKSNRRYY